MPLLQLYDVVRDFGGVRAVDGVSLSLAGGELRVLLGPNGCGKTTLFHIISGGLRPSAGRIELAGRDVTGWPPHRIARAGIARKFQVPTVFGELTVAENLALGRWGSVHEASCIADLERLGLSGKQHLLASSLSHGERQWLELGIALASQPRILLLDEPTAGMTFAEARKMGALLRNIAAEGNTAVFVIEHNIAFVEQLECAVTVLARGKILMSGSLTEVRASPAVRALYFGGNN